MPGIGKLIPLGNSVGPNMYPVPRFMPAVCVYNSIIKFGSIAHFFCCKLEFAYSIARAFDGPQIRAPLDFIVVKNSDKFISYPKELLFAICAAICVNRSVVAFPPVPPGAVWVVTYTACAGLGSHNVSLPDCSSKNLSRL